MNEKFVKLNSDVLEASIGSARITDVKEGTYNLELKDDKISLVDSKKKAIGITINTLAGLRIVTSAEKAKVAATTRDARESDDYMTLQDALKLEGGPKLDETTKFNVVHRLKIHDSVNDKPVYRNECYKGYPAYVKAAREAANLDVADPTRNTKFNEATDALRASELKAGIIESPKTLQMLPVFTITA